MKWYKMKWYKMKCNILEWNVIQCNEMRYFQRDTKLTVLSATAGQTRGKETTRL